MFYSQVNTGAVVSVRQMKWEKKAAAGLWGHQRSTLGQISTIATESWNVVAYQVNESSDYSWIQQSLYTPVWFNFLWHDRPLFPFFFCTYVSIFLQNLTLDKASGHLWWSWCPSPHWRTGPSCWNSRLNRTKLWETFLMGNSNGWD